MALSRKCILGSAAGTALSFFVASSTACLTCLRACELNMVQNKTLIIYAKYIRMAKAIYRKKAKSCVIFLNLLI